jgi:trehalose utilization protein
MSPKYFIRSAKYFFLCGVLHLNTAVILAAPIRVVIWDERQELQKTAYGDYLGNTLAAELAQYPDFTVKSVGLNDPDQGLTTNVLDHCDVLIWWGHQKHDQVTPDHVQAVVNRLLAGKLSLIALHSAHWSKPFITAMNERSIADALKIIPARDRNSIQIVKIPPAPGMPKRNAPLTPSSHIITNSAGSRSLEVKLPSCVFPHVSNDGKPGHITTQTPSHPIASGLPANFDIPQTEVYGGPFHVPKPDAVIFSERWDNGESFTSGCVWQVGLGKVFYFRPGHETYPIFKQAEILKIISNAVRWAAPSAAGSH